MRPNTPKWLKPKGYLHITPQLNLEQNCAQIIKKVQDPAFVKKYNFFPLIHTNLKDRKFKKVPKTGKRAHSFIDENLKPKSNAKIRPLHYSTHLDSVIFGYYNHLIINKYEDFLATDQELSDSIIAYRRIPLFQGAEANKSTIHFAHESFEAIKQYAHKFGDISVLAFDIKNFFPSLDHQELKRKWEYIFGWEKLPDDHYKVFKAATNFSYILKIDLKRKDGRGYDEKRLAKIRQKGYFSFFESAKEFRDFVKEKKIRIYTNPFMENGKPVGIPQGLPLSATLANLYLLDFDKTIIDKVVKESGGFYRRYSDDILIICNLSDQDRIKQLVYSELTINKVKYSEEKTDIYLFKMAQVGKKKRLQSFSCGSGILKPKPLIYLGFEFHGYQTLIKSTNLAKFYRRMIQAVKNKVKIAYKISKAEPEKEIIIYRRQLYKLYTLHDLNGKKVQCSRKRLVKNERGYFDLISHKSFRPIKSNYLSYVARAASIMAEPKIKNQIKSHKRIFNEAINKHLKKMKNWQ